MSDNSPAGSINQPDDKKKKSRRPANTAFRQQRLKAWQPILTPKTVIPLFFVIGLICAPIGGLLIYASSTVKELQIDYTNCYKDAQTTEQQPIPSENIQAAFPGGSAVTAQWKRQENVQFTYMPGNYTVNDLTRCTIQFNIPVQMEAPVYFYYRLGNFYQNHRKYVASFFDKQLKGDAVTVAETNASACDPLRSNGTQQYYPCGLIANSMFNDSFSDFTLLNSNQGSNNETYKMTSKGISWASDQELFGPTQLKDWNTVIPPPNWQIRYKNGRYSDDAPPPNIQEDEHFIVWMRTAGLPTFSKLYSKNMTDPMKVGDYQIDIIDNFRTNVYQGSKSIVITTLSPMGGRNNFLGILWLVVGGFCILLAVIFLITNLVKPRKLGDHTYLSWNNAPASAAAKGKGKASGPSTAMATGRDI